MTVLDVALVLVRLAIGCWLLWSLPRLASAHGVDRQGVSVIVPARDEADQLPALLASLPDDIEVIVVDDASTDATAEVARAAGATLVAAPPLPEGWVGKSWACSVGAARAGGRSLVFVDADVRFAEDALDRVLATLEDTDGLVSVQPFHEPGAPVEHLAALFNVVAVAATDTASPLGRRRGARGAFGPVLACRRGHYERIGGHESIRHRVTDDVALAERFTRAGLAVSVRGGGPDVSFRMYPLGLRQLVEGFSKNLAAGARAARRSTVALVVLWLSLLVQAALGPLLAVGGGDRGEALLLYGVVAAQVWWMARRVGRFGPLTALAFPVLAVTFLVVFVRSVLASARGAVSWRGRRLATRPPRDHRPGRGR